MKIRFLSIASIELHQAFEYYEHQLPGLGIRFFHEVDASINRINFMPSAWTKIGKHTRRCLINGFPYAIYYVFEAKEIIITAVAHLHRNPQYYNERIM